MANTKKTREQWRRLVAEWGRSGLSAEVFAGRHPNVNPRTLSWWRSKLRREGGKVVGASLPAFLAVTVKEEVSASCSVATRGPVEVVLLNGVRVRFEHALDAAGLTTLGAALGSLS